MARGDKEKNLIELILRKYFKKEEILREHKGIKGRQFRFDWAIPHIKLAIEYEGIVSSKSRHTTFTGYSTDCRKYNLAMLNGWNVLRYTTKNYPELTVDLHHYLRDLSKLTASSSK